MRLLTGSTITALSTPPLPSAIAIIRVSGSASCYVINSCFKSTKNPIEFPRTLITGHFINPENSEILDHCLAVYMPAPNTFTGEDIVEFQIHGSPVLAKQILNVLYKLGIEPARAGEFSERAFLNNKLDLTQAEAIISVINSTSEAELKLSEQQLSGKLTKVINQIGEPLRDMLAEIEANIDFPEEDISPESISEIKTKLEVLNQQIKDLITSYDYGSVIKEGLKVLIFGKPNVGKSSLLNHFLRTERAIVTPISGTTRDLLEETASIQGIKFIFCDTAGITDTNDQVEKIGVQRAKDRLAWADLILLTISADKLSDLEFWQNELKNCALPIWLLINKSDLNTTIDIEQLRHSFTGNIFKVSALTGAGLEELEKSLVHYVQNKETSTSVTLTNERHKNCLVKSQNSLDNTINAINLEQPLEIISSELRIALNSLEEIIGRTYTEDILGRIFAKFCVGK